MRIHGQGPMNEGSRPWTRKPNRIGAPRRGWAIPTPPTVMPAPLGERLRTIASMALFVVLAGYVGFSAIRLGLLLWQRFAVA